MYPGIQAKGATHDPDQIHRGRDAWAVMMKDFDLERDFTEAEKAHCAAVGAMAERALDAAITLTMWEEAKHLEVTQVAYRRATACASFRMIMPLRRARAHALVGKDHDEVVPSQMGVDKP